MVDPSRMAQGDLLETGHRAEIEDLRARLMEAEEALESSAGVASMRSSWGGLLASKFTP